MIFVLTDSILDIPIFFDQRAFVSAYPHNYIFLVNKWNFYAIKMAQGEMQEVLCDQSTMFKVRSYDTKKTEEVWFMDHKQGFPLTVTLVCRLR